MKTPPNHFVKAVLAGLICMTCTSLFGVTALSNAYIGPTSGPVVQNYCIYGQTAHVTIEATVPPSKRVNCTWQLIIQYLNGRGVEKSAKLMLVQTILKQVPVHTNLIFTQNISAKLNKKLAKRAMQAKFQNGILRASLAVALKAKPLIGKSEEVTMIRPVTIYLDHGSDTSTVDMVLIPDGSFAMGDAFSEGDVSELPTHSVYVSAFYMDKYEVTKAKWDNVHSWAISNGYVFDNAGSGKAPTHPVHTVNWYDCVKWCNARSEKEGLTPCFTVGGNVYKTGQSAPDCNWSANGYRLPTEAEREKAARGGLNGLRFPWNDLNITHTNANYFSSGYSYDTSNTRGFHPTFNDGIMPYTSPVGYFAPNGYGLYDMAGNVWEWCWDWYDSNYYSVSSANDPRGPASSPISYRMLRGGTFYWYGAFGCRVSDRPPGAPHFPGYYFGFRCVRGL